VEGDLGPGVAVAVRGDRRLRPIVDSSQRSLLLVRAETGPGIGHGHLARTYALAEEWVDRGGAVSLLMSDMPMPWRQRFDALTGPEEPQAAGRRWGVLDGYHFAESDQREMATRCDHVLVIDDHGSIGRYRADIVLDQNLGARADQYATAPDGTQLLLGPAFALLRADIRALAAIAVDDVTSRAPLVAVALGGEPSDATSAAGRALVRNLDHRNVQAVVLDGTQDAAAVFAQATLAVSAAGSTVWELCAAGVASMLFTVAPNQVAVQRALVEAGACLDAGGGRRGRMRHRFSSGVAGHGSPVAAAGSRARSTNDHLPQGGALPDHPQNRDPQRPASPVSTGRAHARAPEAARSRRRASPRREDRTMV